MYSKLVELFWNYSIYPKTIIKLLVYNELISFKDNETFKYADEFTSNTRLHGMLNHVFQNIHCRALTKNKIAPWEVDVLTLQALQSCLFDSLWIQPYCRGIKTTWYDANFGTIEPKTSQLLNTVYIVLQANWKVC